MTGLYSGGFVASILINDKLQEIAKDGTVTIPFNSEYSIKLTNKNDKRAVAKIFIDDENVSGGGFVIDSYNSITIERPVNKAVKFKFVSLTSDEAKEAGKTDNTKKDKGALRIEFQLEKPQQTYFVPNTWDNYPEVDHPWKKRGPYPEPLKKGLPYPYERFETTCGGGGGSADSGARCSAGDDGSYSSYTPAGGNSLGLCSASTSKASNAGCTVDGEYSKQMFSYTNIELEDKPAVIIMMVLRGYDEETFDSKSKYCSNCGRKVARKSDRFCSKCGNRLD